MIKITHIPYNKEKECIIKIAQFLKKEYKGYFEIKCYGLGVRTSPTDKIIIIKRY